jgi:hypothetical protein
MFIILFVCYKANCVKPKEKIEAKMSCKNILKICTLLNNALLPKGCLMAAKTEA